MGIGVRVVDQTFPGEASAPWTLRVTSDRVDARTLIRRRVEHELAGPATGGAAEAVPPRATAPLPDALERAVADAVAAFEANGFVMLVDDLQVESLDEAVDVTDDTVVMFLRLVPLVGG